MTTDDPTACPYCVGSGVVDDYDCTRPCNGCLPARRKNVEALLNDTQSTDPQVLQIRALLGADS